MPEGKYIYSIVKADRDENFGYTGINNREVNLLHYKDIGAVVSSSPVINFDRLDKRELTRHVSIHQKVNEQVMKDYDMVPMMFGIIAPSVSETLRILEKAYLQFKTALKEVAGKVEFAVQVCWDKEGLLSEILPINPEVLRKAYIKDIRTLLGIIACNSTLNKLIDENMLANFSFLIEKVKEAELDKKMQEIGKKYEEKLRFKYIGPMPPYSFSNINLSLGNFELVQGARKLLGLPGQATLGEIKKAYYILSHQHHPDKHQGDEEQMKKITQAYSILENYCQSCDELMGKVEGRKYSFKEKDVKDSIIVSY